MSAESYWHHTAGPSPPTYPPLQGDRSIDVVIIGAGITGLTAALHLKRAGRQVAVMEAGRVGAGTTGGTSGHLDVLPDQGLVQLIKDFGEAAAREITHLRAAAISQIETWCGEYSIDCDFRRIPAVAYTEHDHRSKRIRAELEAAQALGLPASPVANAGLPFPVAAAWSLADQARFHSLRYLRALAAEVHGENGAIYEHTPAETPEDGTPCEVQTPGGMLRAAEVLLATHSAFLGISQFDLRQAPYQSYVLAVRVQDRLPDALLWDDEDPYHYLRLASSADPDLLLVGGADHKTGQADERQHFQQLADYCSRRFKVQSIEQRWSAEFFEPADGVPFIGRVPLAEHLYLGTGYSGTGLTFGTLAGLLLSDLVLGRPATGSEVFSPSRLKPLAAGWELVSENLNAARRFVMDRFAAEPIESLEEVPPGEGRLVAYRGEHRAVYRDESGRAYILSPVCTHAGCQVHWNGAEKTWDCPCHGGRFAPTGQRLYGPPPADLRQKSTGT